MKNNLRNGFTLIELLIAMVVIGVISAVSTQILFDTLTVKSKQNSLEQSTDASYVIIEQIVSSLKTAKSVNIPNANLIEIQGDALCVNYRYNLVNLSIERAQDVNPPCSPDLYLTLTRQDTKITNFNFSPPGFLPENVSILIEGESQNSLGVHPFKYQTSVVPRVSL